MSTGPSQLVLSCAGGAIMGALLPVRHAGHVTAFLGPRKEKKKIPSDHHPCHSSTPHQYATAAAMLHTEVCWGTVMDGLLLFWL
jgi:hypothetical protein